MTLIDSHAVTTTSAGAVTMTGRMVPAQTAGRFPTAVPTVPTQTVPAADRALVPVSTVPRPTGSDTDAVSTDGWTAWFSVELDTGDGWETADAGDHEINAGTQTALDAFVDARIESAQVGARYGVVRVSAATLDARGRSLISYREIALPQATRSN